jgi:T-lymphoma invasion and metastasis-inducing protein 1
MDMFTYYCNDGHVYLLLYWWTCLPTTVLMDIFTYYCIDGHVYPLLYWWTCLPTTVLMDMFTYYCIDWHVYPLLYWWTCLPTTVLMDMFTYYCIDGHVYHVCHICWFALPEALFLMLFQIRVFIEMVKLLEYKHFNIISHFCYYLNS